MKNKYVILSSVYRFKESYDENTPIEKLEKNYLSVKTANNIITRKILSNAIKSCFEVADYESTMEIFTNYFEESTYVNVPIEIIFTDIYLDNKDELDSLTQEYIEERYLNEENIKSILDRAVPAIFFHKDKMSQLEYEEFVQHCINEIRELVIINYNEKSEYFNCLFKLFKEFEPLLHLSRGVGFHGFNISRIVDIVTSSYTLGYLEEEHTAYLLDSVGNYSEHFFGNWQRFLASSILGKMFMMMDGDMSSPNIMKSRDYIESIYGLLISKSKPLFVSGLWENNDLDFLAKILRAYLGEEEEVQERVKLVGEDAESKVEKLLDDIRGEKDNRETKAIEFFNFVLGNEISNRGIESLFYAGLYAKNIYFPIEEKKDDILDYYFWSPIKSLGIDFKDDEVPFLYSKKVLFTNKAIYLLNKRLFKKVEIKVLSWEDDLVFDLKREFFDIKFLLNGEKFGYMQEMDYKGVNSLSNMKELSMEELDMLVDELIARAKDMFKELPNKIKEYENRDK